MWNVIVWIQLFSTQIPMNKNILRVHGLSHMLKIWGLKRLVYMEKCYKVIILFNLLIPKNFQFIGK